MVRASHLAGSPEQIQRALLTDGRMMPIMCEYLTHAVKCTIRIDIITNKVHLKQIIDENVH